MKNTPMSPAPDRGIALVVVPADPLGSFGSGAASVTQVDVGVRVGALLGVCPSSSPDGAVPARLGGRG